MCALYFPFLPLCSPSHFCIAAQRRCVSLDVFTVLFGGSWRAPLSYSGLPNVAHSHSKRVCAVTQHVNRDGRGQVHRINYRICTSYGPACMNTIYFAAKTDKPSADEAGVHAHTSNWAMRRPTGMDGHISWMRVTTTHSDTVLEEIKERIIQASS